MGPQHLDHVASFAGPTHGMSRQNMRRPAKAIVRKLFCWRKTARLHSAAGVISAPLIPTLRRGSQAALISIRYSPLTIRTREHQMGLALRITRTEHTAAELRAFAIKGKDGAQVRRLLAIALVLDGRSRSQAAEQTGMDRQILRDWVHRYNADGIDGLKSRCTPGRAAALSEAQRAEFRALVVNGLDPAKHKVVRWRCLDLRQEVARRFLHEVRIKRNDEWHAPGAG